MCAVFLKLSVLFLSVAWCPAPDAPQSERTIEPAGLHIRITPDAIEFSIRLSRERKSRPGARAGAPPRTEAAYSPFASNSAWFSFSHRIDVSTRSRPLG